MPGGREREVCGGKPVRKYNGTCPRFFADVLFHFTPLSRSAFTGRLVPAIQREERLSKEGGVKADLGGVKGFGVGAKYEDSKKRGLFQFIPSRDNFHAIFTYHANSLPTMQTQNKQKVLTKELKGTQD